MGEIIKSNLNDEEALISAASNGDSAAFGQIVTKYQALVYNTIKLKVLRFGALDWQALVFCTLAFAALWATRFLMPGVL